MQEIIDYIKFGFKLFVTPYGLVAWVIIMALCAGYILLFNKSKIHFLIIARIATYSFLFIVGLTLIVVAELLEKSLMQTTGAVIFLSPILVELVIFNLFKFRVTPK